MKSNRKSLQNGDSIRDIGPQCAGQEHEQRTNQCYTSTNRRHISIYRRHNSHEEYTKSKTIDEEANNPCCLMLYDMQDGRRRRCIKYSRNSEPCPVYHPYLPQFLQLFLLKWLSLPSSFLSIHERYHQRY